MASLSARPALRGIFVDKENVLASKPKAAGGGAGPSKLQQGGAGTIPLKSGAANGRAPLKTNVPANVPVNKGLDKVAGPASKPKPAPAKEPLKAKAASPKATLGTTTKVAPLGAKAGPGPMKSPKGNETARRPLLRDITNRTPGTTTKKSFKPLKDAPAPTKTESAKPSLFNADSFKSPDLSKMPVHPVSRDSNPLQDRKKDSAVKAQAHQSPVQVTEPSVAIAEASQAAVEDEEWDLEVEYAPPKREYDELQDVPQPPEIDYEAIRSALFEAPIIVPAAVKERFSKMDPFALPEDKEAESWDYFMKGTSDDTFIEYVHDIKLDESREIAQEDLPNIECPFPDVS